MLPEGANLKEGNLSWLRPIWLLKLSNHLTRDPLGEKNRLGGWAFGP